MLTPTRAVIAVIVVAIVAYLVFMFDIPYGKKVTDFASCIAAGNPVMESYPRQCRDAEGNLYVEEIEEPTVSDMIRVDMPLPNAAVSSPVTVSGEARGNWYFEASFPVQIFDANGTMIGQAPVQAQGEWMTTDFVPFSAAIPFSKSSTDTGYIRFMKDNASGLPEHDRHIDVPVRFGAATTTAGTKPACIVSGCSGQICSDQEMVSTCEYRAEYACYQTARCERQASGQCGWTQTAALAACLANPSQL